MRIAVFGDVHGNLAALEAVLAEIDRLKPDHIIGMGDYIDGAPDSIACWRRVRERGIPLLRGNHERYVFDFGTERASPEWSAAHFSPVRWAVKQCPDPVRADMAALPISMRLVGAPELFFAHASARSDHDSVFFHTPDHVLAPMFQGVTEPVIVRAHNHLAGNLDWAGGKIVNIGSVGIPLDGHTLAQYAVLEDRPGAGWSVRHHGVSYDVALTLRRFKESGYLEEGGPMARLFLREIATAAHPNTRYGRPSSDLR